MIPLEFIDCKGIRCLPSDGWKVMECAEWHIKFD